METAKVVRLPAWERQDGFVPEHFRGDLDLVPRADIPAKAGLGLLPMELQNSPDIFALRVLHLLVCIRLVQRRDDKLARRPAREQQPRDAKVR